MVGSLRYTEKEIEFRGREGESNKAVRENQVKEGRRKEPKEKEASERGCQAGPVQAITS